MTTDHRPKSPHYIIPEVQVLDDMPVQFRARFEKAVKLMYTLLGEAITWEQIAEQCAISPFHFHRQFTQLFFETPGQYMSRMRIQFAVELLIEKPKLSITDVAHVAGYSSSQAMAKVFNRVLSVTPKKIRQLMQTGTPEQMSNLLAKLAAPENKQMQEYQLASEANYEVNFIPARYLKKEMGVSEHAVEEYMFATEDAGTYVSVLPLHQLENAWTDIDISVGNFVESSTADTILVPEGQYLCSDVLVISAVGYDASWQGLFDYAERENLDLDDNGFCVEISHGGREDKTEGYLFSFQIPLKG